MQLSEPGSETARQRLYEVRQTLFTLHKALLDSERTSYELGHGPIGSPAAFLQLLIHDPWFAWLQPITSLLVQIDEALAAKKPPRSKRELDGFWKRYSASLERDPAVALLHWEIKKQLAT